MNLYQTMGVLVIGILLFAGVVLTLVSNGVSVVGAMLGVYCSAMVSMFFMQKRACDAQDDVNHGRRMRDQKRSLLIQKRWQSGGGGVDQGQDNVMTQVPM